MKKSRTKKPKGLPTSIRFEPDIQQKIAEFMLKENRPFPNALDELLRKAFAVMEGNKIDENELKKTLEYTINRLHEIEKLEHERAIEEITKKNSTLDKSKE